MKVYPKRYVLLIFAIPIFGIMSCGKVISEQDNISVNSFASSQKEVVREVDFEETKTENWKAQRVSINAKEPFRKMFFLSENLGWVCDLKTIWKTEDGGKVWKSYPMPTVAGTNVRSLRFLTPDEGWIVIERFGVIGEMPPSKFWIYHSVDGGKSWNISKEVSQAVLIDSYFSTKKNWILASKLTAENNLSFQPLLLRFYPDSSAWLDRSDPLTKTLESFRQRDFPIELPRLLTMVSDGCLTVINKTLDSYQSCDDGNNWKQFDQRLKSEYDGRSEIGVNDFQLCDNDVWLVRGTGGIHGTESLIYILNTQDPKVITKLNLANVYLSRFFCESGNLGILAGDELDDRGEETGVVILVDKEKKTKTMMIRTGNQVVDAYSFSTKGILWFLDDKGQAFSAAPQG